MSSELVKQAAGIVEAYVSNNEIHPGEVPTLIRTVFASLATLAAGEEETAPAPVPRAASQAEDSGEPPSAPVKRVIPAATREQAVTEEAILCMVCGKSCRALRGHLTRSHQMTPEEYRNLFDLPKNFPMVAPAYSAKRRQLALDAGLGEKLRDSRKKGGDA